jgi:hypothetical protein
MISVICVVYGRVSLPETIRSFLDQNVINSELVILNTNVDQHLVLDGYDNIKVYNLDFRPNLPDAHNIAVGYTTGEYVTVLDDDDVWMPWVLGSYEAIIKTAEYDVVSPHGYCLQNAGNIHSITESTAPNWVMYNKKTLVERGGYSFNTHQYDFDQTTRTKMESGSRVKRFKPLTEGLLVYRVGSNIYSASVFGDIEGREQRIKSTVKSAMDNGSIKSGRVCLNDLVNNTNNSDQYNKVRKFKEPKTIRQATLTVGMACYDDYQGVFFSLASLMNGPFKKLINEVIILDNNPDSEDGKLTATLGGGVVRYITHTEKKSTSIRSELFNLATSDYVLVIDCHVLLNPDGADKLQQFLLEPITDDLYHGILVDHMGNDWASHMDPVWNELFFGKWTEKTRRDNIPFEIPMHGMGLFMAAKRSWPGFSKHFRSWGGEEGYIHQKYRNAGHKVMCLPWIRWVHRFKRVGNHTFPNPVRDKLFNYLVGWKETGLDVGELIGHFTSAQQKRVGGAYTAPFSLAELKEVEKEVDEILSLR